MPLEQLKPGYEYVHTVTEYYDGPRAGIANYHGQPHIYECVFDENAGRYSELFLLAPVDSETFKLAMESWSIWRRWEQAYHSGKAELNTHPALPEDSVRHKQLKEILDRILVIDTEKSVTRIGRFEALGNALQPKGVLRNLQVEWNEPSGSNNFGESP